MSNAVRLHRVLATRPQKVQVEKYFGRGLRDV